MSFALFDDPFLALKDHPPLSAPIAERLTGAPYAAILSLANFLLRPNYTKAGLGKHTEARARNSAPVRHR
jgi:hypothetical protein